MEFQMQIFLDVDTHFVVLIFNISITVFSYLQLCYVRMGSNVQSSIILSFHKRRLQIDTPCTVHRISESKSNSKNDKEESFVILSQRVQSRYKKSMSCTHHIKFNICKRQLFHTFSIVVCQMLNTLTSF